MSYVALKAFGSITAEAVVCPSGWEPKLIAGTDQFTCELCLPSTSDPASPPVCQTVPPLYKPTKVENEVSFGPAVGWFLLAGLAFLIGAKK